MKIDTSPIISVFSIKIINGGCLKVGPVHDQFSIFLNCRDDSPVQGDTPDARPLGSRLLEGHHCHRDANELMWPNRQSCPACVRQCVGGVVSILNVEISIATPKPGCNSQQTGRQIAERQYRELSSLRLVGRLPPNFLLDSWPPVKQKFALRALSNRTIARYEISGYS